MSDMLGSKKVRAILWILGGLIVLFMTFGLGIAVGYQRAGFAAGIDRNYYRIFFNGPAGPMGMMAPPIPAMVHGVVGKVIDLGTSTISVADQEGNEQSVAILSDTVIRNGGTAITVKDIVLGDTIAVIGEPNGEGQINGRFIRILTTP